MLNQSVWHRVQHLILWLWECTSELERQNLPPQQWPFIFYIDSACKKSRFVGRDLDLMDKPASSLDLICFENLFPLFNSAVHESEKRYDDVEKVKEALVHESYMMPWSKFWVSVHSITRRIISLIKARCGGTFCWRLKTVLFVGEACI